MQVPSTSNHSGSSKPKTGINLFKVEIDKESTLKPISIDENTKVKTLRIPFLFTPLDGGKGIKYTIYIEDTLEVFTSASGVRQQVYLNDVGSTFNAVNEEVLNNEATSGNPRKWFANLCDPKGVVIRPRKVWAAKKGEKTLYWLLKDYSSINSFDPKADLLLDTKKLWAGNFDELAKGLEDCINPETGKPFGIKALSYINDKGFMTIFNPKFVKHLFSYAVDFDALPFEINEDKKAKDEVRFINQVLHPQYGCSASLLNGLTWTDTKIAITNTDDTYNQDNKDHDDLPF